MTTIKSFRYNNITDSDARLLNDLLETVWKDNGRQTVHPPKMDAMSFCMTDKDKFISYTGVLTWDIQVKKQTFKMGALSCVCTHPLYRRKGIGKRLVKKATEWMCNSRFFDIGLFTCSPENIPFYESTGLWKACPTLVLKESDRQGAYASDTLGLNVFRLLISEKSVSHISYFENTVITLDLPEGQFI